MMGPAGRLRLPVRERDLRVPQATFRVDEAVTAAEVDTPISSREVRLIASQGFPLWEPVPVMVLRNRRITIAYADLSRRLADAIAGDGSARQANWCTYATWSSRTIGNWIDPEARQAPIPDRPGWGDSLERTLRPLTEWLVARDNGATYRSLAAGNRYVFLEIGLAVACFLEHVEHAGQGVRHEATWSRYWDHMASVLDELTQLDPSWMLTESPPRNLLRDGMRRYFDALCCADAAQQAEHVLAANLLIGAYEQRRVDGYVTASLALFTDRAMRRLLVRGAAPRAPWLGLPSAAYARLMSRFLVLEMPDEELRLSRPLRPPAGGPMFPDDLATISDPLVQALLTRYDLSDGRADRRRVRDWTSFDDRMSYITNLFRSRQQHRPLFAAPYPADVEKRLLAGELAG